MVWKDLVWFAIALVNLLKGKTTSKVIPIGTRTGKSTIVHYGWDITLYASFVGILLVDLAILR